jgi:hypothetical protein
MWAIVRKSAAELAPPFTFSRYWFSGKDATVACSDRFSAIVNHSVGFRSQSTDASQQTIDAQGESFFLAWHCCTCELTTMQRYTQR